MVRREEDRAFLWADEIGQLGAVQDRNGSSLGAILRSMLSGAAVSTTNADATRRRHLDAHSYRLCVVAGVQPALSDILLRDSDAGTPQRWLWLPTWAELPETDIPWPGPLSGPLLTPTDDMEYPDHVRDFVRDQHRKRVAEKGEALDGHAILTRLKVAAGLALMHGRKKVDDEMWDLSGRVMAVSDSTRAVCVAAVDEKQEAEHRARGRAQAVQQDATTEMMVERCIAVLEGKVRRDGPQKRRQLKDAAGKRYRPVLDEALEKSALVKDGTVWGLP